MFDLNINFNLNSLGENSFGICFVDKCYCMNINNIYSLKVQPPKLFIFLLFSRKGKHSPGQAFSFMTMVERSPTKTALRKKAASVRDLDEAEVRGVMNTAYADDTDGADNENYQGGWFMVNNPEFTKHKMNYMDEVLKIKYQSLFIIFSPFRCGWHSFARNVPRLMFSF